jgi:carboxymethylenebutenolidase
MGEKLTLHAEDGAKFSAYRATPAGTPRGGLVIVQEIFGVNGHIRRVCDGFAGEGYVALAPALFDRVEPGYEAGYGPDAVERGRNVRQKVGWDLMVTDTRAAVEALKKSGLKVGVVGYCMGGSMAWLAATRIPGVAAAVGYYGGAVAEFADESPRCPVLLHFGEADATIPREHWDRIREAQPTIPMHIYPAGHGFNCDARGSYHEPSARLARERTLEFLKRHM